MLLIQFQEMEICSELCWFQSSVLQDSMHFTGEQRCFFAVKAEVSPSYFFSLIAMKSFPASRGLLFQITVVNIVISEWGEREKETEVHSV